MLFGLLLQREIMKGSLYFVDLNGPGCTGAKVPIRRK